MAEITGGELLACCLANEGVRFVFGSPCPEQHGAIEAWSGDGVHPAHVMDAVGRVFGRDAIYATDGGNTSLWANLLLPSTRPRSYLNIRELVEHGGAQRADALGPHLRDRDGRGALGPVGEGLGRARRVRRAARGPRADPWRGRRRPGDRPWCPCARTGRRTCRCPSTP